MDLSGSWQYIEETARSRLAHNKTKRHVSNYGDGIEVIGVAGEVIVRRFLGLPEQVHEGFDHGVDIQYFGMRIDVKATILTPNANFRFLQWPNWKKVRADYIVMTLIDPINQVGTVAGWVTKEEILASPINPNRSTPCHEIAVMELHRPHELIVEVCRRRTQAALGQFPPLETIRSPRLPSRGGSSTRKRSGKRAGAMGSASRGSSSATDA